MKIRELMETLRSPAQFHAAGRHKEAESRRSRLDRVDAVARQNMPPVGIKGIIRYNKAASIVSRGDDRRSNELRKWDKRVSKKSSLTRRKYEK